MFHSRFCFALILLLIEKVERPHSTTVRRRALFHGLILLLLLLFSPFLRSRSTHIKSSHSLPIMYTFPSEQEWRSTCPVKQRTDSLGGVKVQVYGLDSYGYLQFKGSCCKEWMPKDLEDCLTEDEWMNFWETVNFVLKKHRAYDCLMGIWIVVGIFVCTAFMGLHDFRLGFIVALLFTGLLGLVSSCPRSCKSELNDLCRSWSQQRRMLDNGTKPLVEARFFHESGPSTRHGQNSLGVIHFLAPQGISVKNNHKKQQELQQMDIDERKEATIRCSDQYLLAVTEMV